MYHSNMVHSPRQAFLLLTSSRFSRFLFFGSISGLRWKRMRCLFSCLAICMATCACVFSLRDVFARPLNHVSESGWPHATSLNVQLYDVLWCTMTYCDVLSTTPCQPQAKPPRKKQTRYVPCVVGESVPSKLDPGSHDERKGGGRIWRGCA